jgi:serine O-acetyltransferase
VVGIPGRIVRPDAQAHLSAHGIDLEHHLMPDPVGKAIACLIDHINRIEARLEAHTAAEMARAPLSSLNLSEIRLDGVACESCGNLCDQEGCSPSPSTQQHA